MFLWCILFCLRFWNQLYWLHLSVTLLILICRGQDDHFILIHGVTYCCMIKAADVSEICTACLSALVQWCRLFMAVVTLLENFLLMNTYNGFLGIPLSSLKPLTSNISSINWSVKKFKTPQILLGTFLISNAHRMGVKFVVFEVFCDVTEFWGWALSGHAGWPIKPTKNKNLSLNLWNTQNSLCGSGRHRWRASLLISPAQRHLLHPSDPSFQLGMYPPPSSSSPPHTQT